MIQRIQTIWLLLTCALIFALLLFPYFQFATNEGLAQVLKVSGKYGHENGIITQLEANWAMLVLTVVLGVLPLYTILQFKNRKLQLSLILVEIIGVFGLGAWFYFSGNNTLTALNQTASLANFGVGFFLLPLVILFLILARTAIQKDEKLIKSVDRLR